MFCKCNYVCGDIILVVIGKKKNDEIGRVLLEGLGAGNYGKRER